MMPYKQCLESNDRDGFIEELPVKQPKGKLVVITKNSMDFLYKIKNEYMFKQGIFRYIPVAGALAGHTELWKTLAFYTTLILNMMVILSYRTDDPDASRQKRLDNAAFNTNIWSWSEGTTRNVFKGLGIMLIIFSSIVLLSVLFKHLPYTFETVKVYIYIYI